jgi:uroporphyrinogen decarboxylase
MNKIERMEAVFRGEKPDKIPAGFWFHYNHDWDTPRMAEEHIKTYRKTGVDIVKVMQDYVCKLDIPVHTPSDWRKVQFPGTASPVFQKLLDVLKRILDSLGGEVMVFQTMYSPFKNAVISYGDSLVMAHAKTDSRDISAAVEGIAGTLSEWAAAFMEAGAAGIYYAAQFSEPGRFSRQEWEELVKPADIVVLRAAEQKGGRNILHICGEPDYQFKTNPEWFASYPAAIVNWSVKDTGFSLEQGRDLFKKPILGGMNNKGNILSGTEADIAAEAREIISGFGTSGFMLGADCTIQGKGISHDKIRAAVEAAHSYPV